MKRNRNRTRSGYRRVPLNKEMIKILDQQRERFKEKFGRYPGPEDPVIWDESAAEPTPASEDDIHQTILAALIAAGSPPEFIYAFNKTGRLVTESNMHLLTPQEYQEWVDAVEEYRRLN
jgi:hypothetical protein